MNFETSTRAPAREGDEPPAAEFRIQCAHTRAPARRALLARPCTDTPPITYARAEKPAASTEGQ